MEFDSSKTHHPIRCYVSSVSFPGMVPVAWHGEQWVWKTDIMLTAGLWTYNIMWAVGMKNKYHVNRGYEKHNMLCTRWVWKTVTMWKVGLKTYIMVTIVLTNRYYVNSGPKKLIIMLTVGKLDVWAVIWEGWYYVNSEMRCEQWSYMVLVNGFW